MGMDGGEQLGRHLSFLDSGATEEEEGVQMLLFRKISRNTIKVSCTQHRLAVQTRKRFAHN
jgi:hypothetical protein